MSPIKPAHQYPIRNSSLDIRQRRPISSARETHECKQADHTIIPDNRRKGPDRSDEKKQDAYYGVANRNVVGAFVTGSKIYDIGFSSNANAAMRQRQHRARTRRRRMP